jgi:hypothetical protein
MPSLPLITHIKQLQNDLNLDSKTLEDIIEIKLKLRTMYSFSYVYTVNSFPSKPKDVLFQCEYETRNYRQCVM